MKDSTKEYLMAGALSVWGVAKGIAMQSMSRNSASTTMSTHMTAKSVQSHWDKAGALREEEKAAAEVPIGARFLLPSGCFQDKNGKAIEGGMWEVKSRDGRRILLERWGCNSTHWFLWNDIKEYHQK